MSRASRYAPAAGTAEPTHGYSWCRLVPLSTTRRPLSTKPLALLKLMERMPSGERTLSTGVVPRSTSVDTLYIAGVSGDHSRGFGTVRVWVTAAAAPALTVA